MNLASFMKVSRVPATVGGNIEYTIIDGCPNLRCTSKRNLSRAVYHKIRSICIAKDTSSLFINVHSFYEEDKPFTLRDLLMINHIHDVQVNLSSNNGHILLSGASAINAFFRTDNKCLYQTVSGISIIEGVLIVDLVPSIEEIVKMMVFDE